MCAEKMEELILGLRFLLPVRRCGNGIIIMCSFERAMENAQVLDWLAESLDWKQSIHLLVNNICDLDLGGR